MSEECRGLTGFLFGHKFKVVITKSNSLLEIEQINGSFSAVAGLADKYRNETFKCIYCVRCGYIPEQKS